MLYVDSGCIQDRADENSKLQHELRRTRRHIRDEDAKIATFKSTLKNSANILARLLSVRFLFIVRCLLVELKPGFHYPS